MPLEDRARTRHISGMTVSRNSPARWQTALFRLNRRQTNALMAGLFILLFLMLYPPWEHHFRNEVGGIRREPAGFHFLGGPPPRAWDDSWAGAHIRWLMWSAGFLLAGGLTAAFVYGFRDGNSMTAKLMRRYEAD